MPVLSPIHCPWPSKLLSNKKKGIFIGPCWCDCYRGILAYSRECWRAPEYSGMLALVFDWIISMRNHSNALTKDLPEICQQNQTSKQSTAENPALFFCKCFCLGPKEVSSFFGERRRNSIASWSKVVNVKSNDVFCGFR